MVKEKIKGWKGQLENFFERIVVEIAKYTAIPGVIIAAIKTPSYGKEILFAVLVLVNWIILTYFIIRDMKGKLEYLYQKSKKPRRKRT